MANGWRSNLSELGMSVHTGTHVDAPGHMWQRHFEAGFDVDTLDLEILNGPALLQHACSQLHKEMKTMQSYIEQENYAMVVKNTKEIVKSRSCEALLCCTGSLQVGADFYSVGCGVLPAA
ncbi:hypothetical protein E2562_004488 [Oryza meyeriana var. granulata]|uniref:Cyclase family protein n=1 Tax=Oryza meyeriana var. granulata TaxID=110450 RepID=A0A6G1F363_9ORYZ|nr:hypothetical protein E2562_004488 [Oryza meyeriana var. granulata]